MAKCNSCCTEPAGVDVEVFSLWLRGVDVHEAARIRLGHKPLVTGNFQTSTDSLLLRQRTCIASFVQWSHSSVASNILNQQVNLPWASRNALIERYYTFDEAVVREFLGRKLSSKNRKDLDDVSEKTTVALRSCRRQFDNIKQVLKVVDDFEGSLVENIKQHFLLPDQLAHMLCIIGFS